MMPDIAQRDAKGRFLPGHTIGTAHRFRAGDPSANPQGRPWSVRRWMDTLRDHCYGRADLQRVLTDDRYPINLREASVWLLVAIVTQEPPRPDNPADANRLVNQYAHRPANDLYQIAVDPRFSHNKRAAAYTVLRQRGEL